MGEHYRQLQWEDRIQLEALLKAKTPKKKIAEVLHCHISTIYNEIKRGTCDRKTSEWLYVEEYCADTAQRNYEYNLANRGSSMKIGSDYALADYIEEKIGKCHYSPEAVVGEMRLPENAGKFSTTLCPRTIYNYIDKGVFFSLTNDNLPIRRTKKKRSYHRIKRIKRQAGENIVNRPKSVDTREEFGHWEMDSVVGAQSVSKNSLIVLTERKTRFELIYKVERHQSAYVVEVLNSLEKSLGDNFSNIFKTITVDNGSEFARCEEMETSILHKGKKRTKIYYCHPYSSWERGSNENQNRFIRRYIPKGTNFDNMTQEEIKDIQNWMNNYPRRMYGFQSVISHFKEVEEIRLLSLIV